MAPDRGGARALASALASALAGAALAAAVSAAVCAALLAGPAWAAGERVRAGVDRAELAAGELLTLTVHVESPDAPEAVEFAPGELPFEVVSRSSSTGRTVGLRSGGGGGVSSTRTTTHRLRLRPTQEGRLVVPQVLVRVSGTVFATDPIVVKVLPAGTPPAPPAPRGPVPPRGSYRGWERDLSIRLEVDRDEVFAGEQVTASLWILSRVEVSNRRSFSRPPLQGFWAEPLAEPSPMVDVRRNVNGIPMRGYLALKLALFPTRAGLLEIEPFVEDLWVRLASESPFSRLLDDVRVVRRASAPVKVRVKPLPAGAPAGFDAANVGRLALEVRAAEPEAVAGQPLAVRVVATGEGNLRVLSLPDLPAIPGARRFDPTVRDRVDPRGDRFGGNRTVETLLVPERTGELVIPALSWPVFDPRERAYRVLETTELRIPVGPGGAEAGGAGGGNALAAGLRPIRAEALRRAAPPPWRAPAFAALLAAPALGYAVLALVLGARERARAGAGPRRARDAAAAARARLRAARRRHGEGERPALLAEVARALEGYAADRLGRPVAGLTRDALGAALAGAGARPHAVRLLLAALDGCDAARYGGGTGREQELLDAAERALAALETDRPTARGGRP